MKKHIEIATLPFSMALPTIKENPIFIPSHSMKVKNRRLKAHFERTKRKKK